MDQSRKSKNGLTWSLFRTKLTIVEFFFDYNYKDIISVPAKALRAKKILLSSIFILTALILFCCCAYLGLMFEGYSLAEIYNNHGLLPIDDFALNSYPAILFYRFVPGAFFNYDWHNVGSHNRFWKFSRQSFFIIFSINKIQPGQNQTAFSIGVGGSTFYCFDSYYGDNCRTDNTHTVYRRDSILGFLLLP